MCAWNRGVVPFSLGLAIAIAYVCADWGAATADDGCGTLIRKENEASERTVLLAGGNAWELFQSYMREAEKQQVSLSLWKARVVVSNGKDRKEYALGWYRMLSGQGAKESWQGQLKDVKAEFDEAALREAAHLKWDVVCFSDKADALENQGNVASSPAGGQTGGQGGRSGQGEAPLSAKQSLEQGIQFAARHDYENAIKEFTAAIQKHPKYATAFANRGVVYMQQKKFNLAMDDLAKARDLDPKDPFVHYNLTCWYSLENQLDRALVSLDAALSNGFKDYDALRKDPELAKLRKHPEWRKVLERHKVFL